MLIHLMSAAGFALLAGFLFVWRKERAPVGRLTTACILNALWSLGQIEFTTNGIPAIVPMVVFDMMRAGGWLWFAVSLLPPSSLWFEGRIFRLAAIGLPLAIAILVIAGATMAGLDGADVRGIFVYGSLTIVVTGLVILEQAYRNAPEESRWGMKMLIVGVGAVFAYDLFLFSHALLFSSISIEKWLMRGPANLLVIPLLIIGARRYQPMDLDVFVSRHVVFFSATLFGAGAYLIAMAAAGFYLRAIGGEWGPLLQAAFLVGAMILLVIVLLSGSLRSRLKVFLAKHFYANRYDYREQWLALTRTLADDTGEQTLGRRSMRAIGAIAGSNAGVLWMEDPRESNKGAFNYRPVDYWNLDQHPGAIPTDAPLIVWLKEQMWVLNTEDCRQRPEIYGQLTLPEWLENLGRYQLILPLLAEGRLCGLMVLCEPKLGPQLDYEDIDLLKTVGSQVAAVMRHSGDRPLPELGNIDDQYVRADPEALGSIVGHVIRNAQQACDPDAGCVTVSVVCNGDRAGIQIEDNGSGMDEAFVRDRLFRPFDTTKGSQGMGIGAYQVREFVEQAGGRVHVESEPGRGTIFRLCFPGLDLRPAAAGIKEIDQSNVRRLSDGNA